MTGSKSVNENEIMHSGTGRINKLTMVPMSLFESKESNGQISIIELFYSPDMDIDDIKSDINWTICYKKCV